MSSLLGVPNSTEWRCRRPPTTFIQVSRFGSPEEKGRMVRAVRSLVYASVFAGSRRRRTRRKDRTAYVHQPDTEPRRGRRRKRRRRYQPTTAMTKTERAKRLRTGGAIVVQGGNQLIELGLLVLVLRQLYENQQHRSRRPPSSSEGMRKKVQDTQTVVWHLSMGTQLSNTKPTARRDERDVYGLHPFSHVYNAPSHVDRSSRGVENDN